MRDWDSPKRVASARVDQRDGDIHADIAGDGGFRHGDGQPAFRAVVRAGEQAAFDGLQHEALCGEFRRQIQRGRHAGFLAVDDAPGTRCRPVPAAGGAHQRDLCPAALKAMVQWCSTLSSTPTMPMVGVG